MVWSTVGMYLGVMSEVQPCSPLFLTLLWWLAWFWEYTASLDIRGCLFRTLDFLVGGFPLKRHTHFLFQTTHTHTDAFSLYLSQADAADRQQCVISSCCINTRKYEQNKEWLKWLNPPHSTHYMKVFHRALWQDHTYLHQNSQNLALDFTAERFWVRFPASFLMENADASTPHHSVSYL